MLSESGRDGGVAERKKNGPREDLRGQWVVIAVDYES